MYTGASERLSSGRESRTNWPASVVARAASPDVASACDRFELEKEQAELEEAMATLGKWAASVVEPKGGDTSYTKQRFGPRDMPEWSARGPLAPRF